MCLLCGDYGAILDVRSDAVGSYGAYADFSLSDVGSRSVKRDLHAVSAGMSCAVNS